jgi:predicted acylesterase/phospholipase RssA
MLLDAEELQPYLQTAFDHFACHLDTPFDFVQASFANSPIPLDFGGNILKLAINLMEVWRNKANGRTLFVELSYMVASCIMLDSARNKIRGTAERVFPQYLDHLDAALENFCDRHWPCEYIKPGGGGRCVNVRSGHGSKGHQLQNGKVLAVGEYVSRFSFDSHQDEFQLNVYTRLDQLLQLLHAKIEEEQIAEDRAAADIHKETVMTHFFERVANGHNDKFISHSACFCCLFEPPEHALPCGHVLCTPCLKAYGHVKNETLVEVFECPLEPLKRELHQAWRVSLKPPSAGVRVLSLDGGGIRGIVELEILKQIERAMGGNLAIQNFFDLVIGTSTGGLIALGLTARNWTVEECCNHFQELCEKAFTRRAGGNIPAIGWLIENYNHSKYETQPLEDALRSAFSDEDYLFGGRRRDGSLGSDIKVGVTATSSAGSAVLLTNYNRMSAEKLPYYFQRPENAEAEVKIWEAGRATSAAPRIFKPIVHKPSKQVYTDGAIYYNNPIKVADTERKLIWPNMCNEYPDVLVSIGTAYNPRSHRQPMDNKSPTSPSGVFAHGKSLLKIAIDHIASSLDSEKTWEDFTIMLPMSSTPRSRYIRINPQLPEDPPRLDEVGSLRYLQEVVRNQMLDSPHIKGVADRLLVTSFYFEKTEPIKFDVDGSPHCQGHIRCRLPRQEVSDVGKILRSRVKNAQRPHFIVQEEYAGAGKVEKIPISRDVLERMIREYSFRMNRIQITLSSKVAITEMSLRLDDDSCYPLSGFPRSLLQDEGNPTTIRSSTIKSSRWKGRTPSQQHRRKKWVVPDPAQLLNRSDTISRYSNSGHVLGDSSADDLQMSEKLLTNGPSPNPRNPIVRWLGRMPPPPRLRSPKSLSSLAAQYGSEPQSPGDSPLLSPVDTPVLGGERTYQLLDSTPVHELSGMSCPVELPTSYNAAEPDLPASPHTLFSSSAGLPSPMSLVSQLQAPSISLTTEYAVSPLQVPSRADSHISRPTTVQGNIDFLSSGIGSRGGLEEDCKRNAVHIAGPPSPLAAPSVDPLGRTELWELNDDLGRY